MMEANTSFTCENCKKSFTLKWNLKTHAKTCKGFGNEENVCCDKCDNKFTSKKTLKVHSKKCVGLKTYSCKDCSEKFVVYKHLHKHRQKFHTSAKCDYCDVVIANLKNLKRHIVKKHKGLTPAKARELEMQQIAKNNSFGEKEFNCEYCGKTFSDKSALNRHSSTHTFPCNICKKIFQSKTDLVSHMKIHETVSRHVTKKKVVWADTIEDIKVIPVTKVAFNPSMKSKALEMFDNIERFMAICGSRGASVKMEKFISMYEQNSKVKFEEPMFRAILSMIPEAYRVGLNKNVLHVTFQGGAKPSDIKKRKVELECVIKEIESKKDRYIELVDLPEIKIESYKTAKETIIENIIKFDDDTSIASEDSKKDEPAGILTFEELKQKIERKNLIKKKREQKFSQIDFQLKRMKQLTNLVNKIFLGESRSSLKIDFLTEKIKHCEYSSSSIDKDLKRLIKESNGWLKPWRGWLKRNSSINVKDVLKLF